MNKENVRETLKEIYESLKKENYDPLSQIVGYLNSGDPGYVSSYENARTKIIALDRAEVIQIMLEEFFNHLCVV